MSSNALSPGFSHGAVETFYSNPAVHNPASLAVSDDGQLVYLTEGGRNRVDMVNVSSGVLTTSRFWTQFEAWLSLQITTTEGLTTCHHTADAAADATGLKRNSAPPSSPRCHIAPIYNANSIMADYLQTMWANKTPEEAHAILAKEDVTVTSLKDKEMHLPKIRHLDEEVREVMALAGVRLAECTV